MRIDHCRGVEAARGTQHPRAVAERLAPDRRLEGARVSRAHALPAGARRRRGQALQGGARPLQGVHSARHSSTHSYLISHFILCSALLCSYLITSI